MVRITVGRWVRKGVFELVCGWEVYGIDVHVFEYSWMYRWIANVIGEGKNNWLDSVDV